MARLDRLGDEGKRTVQLASVIGRQFLVRLLDRVAGMADRLDHLLHELLTLEIIYEKSLMPEPAYVFKHAVIQDVAYSSLLTERRRELHRMVGHAIEEIYADRLAEHYEELAHHFLNGEQWAKAFDYLMRAGDRAKDAYANQLALDHYEKALQLAARITPAIDRRRILEIHRRRSQVWMLLTRYAEAITESERMRDLAQEIGDRSAEGEALMDLAVLYWATFRVENVPNVRACASQSLAIARDTGDERLLARSLGGLALVDQLDGRLDEADAKFTESLEIARAQGFRDIAVPSNTWLGAHANWRGDFRRAVPLCLAAEQGAAEIHDGFQELMALAFRCLALIGLGEYSEGLEVIRDGLGKARERNNGFISGRLTNSLGWLYQELGDFRRALDCDREAIEIGQRVKNSNVEVSGLINLAYDHLQLGQPERALPLLEETAVRVEKHSFGAHRWRWTNHLTLYIAEALLATGDPERARAQADIGLAQARATGSLKYVSKAHALRGEAALRAGQWTQAESDLRQALAVAAQIGYPTLTWQTGDLLAQALRAQQRMDEAHDTARAAVEVIDWVASRVPEASLRASFLGWQRVQAARETLDRLARG
jgi:tetratricopeptide (TPR) repeat protein